MTYEVAECAEGVTITLASTDGQRTVTRDVNANAEQIRFTFNEPEEGVRLACNLLRGNDGAFAGRCTDAAGKYATFTMQPPEQSTIGCSE